MDVSPHETDMQIPMSTTYAIHQNTNNHLPSSGSLSTKAVPSVKYRECLKNHAAAIGGSAVDGCGEFMPSGPEGTLEALRCSACTCHRNFHRKEVPGESCGGGGGGPHRRPQLFGGAHRGVLVPHPTTQHGMMVMPLGAIQSSESDEMEGGVRPGSAHAPIARKRFRTKFSADQKERMMEFADRIGWRLQKQDEGLIQQFCQEIGVKRRVLKVWMHNNKHNLVKKAAAAAAAAQALPSNLNGKMSE